MDLRQHLIDAGAHPLEVSQAEAQGQGALRAFAFERLLFPGERRTPAQVWNATGVDPEFGRALWRAMGFAAVPDDVPALVDDDIEALHALRRFLELEMIDEDTVIRMTRLIAQAMARISDALISEFRSSLAAQAERGADEVDDLLPLSNLALRPSLEAEVTYLLRRHLVDAARRQLRTGEEDSPRRTLAVGFADLVRFTEVSQRLDEHQLAELVDGFESTASAIVTGVDGRIVKLIGDEVLFSADDPAAAVDAGLALVEAFSDPDVPEVRVGIAHGSVLVHQGDLFGPVVNLASRAVGVAKPGTVLVDEATSDAIADDPDLDTRPIRPRNLKGIGRTKLFLVRETSAAETDDDGVDEALPERLAELLGRRRRRALARLWRIEG